MLTEGDPLVNMRQGHPVLWVLVMSLGTYLSLKLIIRLVGKALLRFLILEQLLSL